MARVVVRAPVALFLLLCASTAWAQSGGFRVVVVDAADGSPLPGATVSLTNAQGLVAPSHEITDAAGRAVFPVLKVGGGYVIEVALAGFARQRRTDLRVRTSETVQHVVQMSPEVRELVEVTAERGVVDLEQSGSSTKFRSEFIENLPVPGRFYQNVLSLAPGVNDEDGDGNPNVHGARTREFRTLVGGVSNTDPLTGEWLSFVNAESIEELEVLPAGAGVEFGRAAGGFARILQKQGSNEFEGVFNFIFRSSKLDRTGGTGVSGEEIPEFEWLQPSLQVSGPILKDRLWYRLSHEYIDREDPVVLFDRVDVVTRTQSTSSDQLTWQVSPRNKLAFQFQSDPLTIDNFGVTSNVPSESGQTLERGGETYSITWTAPYSPRLLVESLVAYQDHENNLLPRTRGVPQQCLFFVAFTGPSFSSLQDAECLNTDTGRASGSHHESVRDRRQRLTVSGQATYFANRFLGVSHRLKFGVVVENERYFRELDRGPEINFFTETEPFSGTVTGFASTRVAVPRISSGRATGVNWALFVEDQLRPTGNLAITVGLRVDREEIDSDGLATFDPQAEAAEFLRGVRSGLAPTTAARDSFTAFAGVDTFVDELAQVLQIDPGALSLGPTVSGSAFWATKREAQDVTLRRTNFAPRLALAWDPWSNGKTKLAATAGRYYDKIFLGVPLIELEPPSTLLTFTAFPFLDFFISTGLRGGFSPAVSVQMVDRNLETPYQDELSLSFERALAPETSIKLTYIHRDFENQLQDLEINHLEGDFGRCRIEAEMIGRPVVVSSPGVGPVEDPHTGEVYLDSDEGPGDGRIDDCTGNVLSGGLLDPNLEVPDGLPDLYTQNPGWGEILLVGNFNTTEYEAFVVEVVRRMYRGWQLDASYTWSEAVGDAEDFSEIQGNDRNLLADERGFLSYDQRHVFRLALVTLTPIGLRVGGAVRWESGLPFSNLQSKETVFGRAPEYGTLGELGQRFRFRYPSRQRNDQRNPSFWNIDVRLAQEFRLRRSAQLQLTAEVFNLLNDDTWKLDDRINGVTAGQRRFGRSYQIGLRIAF